MATYTVIGVYEDGQVFAHVVQTEDPFTAMILAARDVGQSGGDLQILGTVEGEHVMTAACEDSGTSAWAVDLAAEDE